MATKNNAKLENNDSIHILHVSDFHLSSTIEENASAEKALKTLAEKLSNYRVDYVFHTGDVINSSDLPTKAAESLDIDSCFFSQDRLIADKYVFDLKKYAKKRDDEEPAQYHSRLRQFNLRLKELTEDRFKQAIQVLNDFSSELHIASNRFVFCCGNHDSIRYLSPETIANCSALDDNCPDNERITYSSGSDLEFDPYEPFISFIKEFRAANTVTEEHELAIRFSLENDRIELLLLNTNWKNPYNIKPGYNCVNCQKVIDALSQNVADSSMRIVLAHKPIYEICETARLPYERYTKTEFLSKLQEFVGENGLYLCGDKHTRSITGSKFHDIAHFFAGAPLILNDSNRNRHAIEYNIIEVREGKSSRQKKIHLYSVDNCNNWDCNPRPVDDTVSLIYEKCKQFFVIESLRMFTGKENIRTWENVCQVISKWRNNSPRDPRLADIDILYKSTCKYYYSNNALLDWDERDVFSIVAERVSDLVAKYPRGNILNFRGEYGSGKSSFLELLFIYLLYQYSIGEINFIPAYFNLESDEIKQIISRELQEEDYETEHSYHNTAKKLFKQFVHDIKGKSDFEGQSICYFIDGLDELDYWSYSTEESVGRGILDILADDKTARYIMSYNQQNLPKFKNTMPELKYDAFSDVMYFNPVDVQRLGAPDTRFKDFVKAFIQLKNNSDINSANYKPLDYDCDENECEIIRSFRRLLINCRFLYTYYDFISERDLDNKLIHKNESVQSIYKYYIDKQETLCMEAFDYGYINYAPAIAYLFSYQGYTYDRLKNIGNQRLGDEITIWDNNIKVNDNKIYKTFTYIMNHQDERDYLIAMHYNRELQYYASFKHISDIIPSKSILNEFITRNIAVLIRKLWFDTNKFVITYSRLISRKDLSNTAKSLLLYILAQQKMYSAIRDELISKLFSKENLETNAKWKIHADKSSDKQLQQFMNMNLNHTKEAFQGIFTGNSVEIVAKLIADNEFAEYNRQYQMVYYEDLAIRGEGKRRQLNTERDVVYKAFDFHNSFYYLIVKVRSSLKSSPRSSYPLREYDLFTICDLIKSRLNVEKHCSDPSEYFFFSRKKAYFERSKDVLVQTIEVLTLFLDDNNSPIDKDFQEMCDYFKECKTEFKRHLNTLKSWESN